MHVRVLDRHELILSLVKGKRVLDLGAADNLHMDEKRQNDEWLHEEICRVASHCVGVDTDEECVERLRESGYDIRVGDVEEQAREKVNGFLERKPSSVSDTGEPYYAVVEFIDIFIQ